MSAVSFEGVSKIYGARVGEAAALLAAGLGKAQVLERTGCVAALHDVSLNVAAGEFFVVMGRSGSGKSTLLRAINRLVEPSAGRVRVGGTDVGALSAAQLTHFRKTGVSMVFQHFGLLPHKTVLDNVAFPLILQDVPEAAARERARVWLSRVNLQDYALAMPGALSSGMQQRVGLARALITEAPLLLMDEPFAALDPLTRMDMQDEVLRLKADFKKTVVMISHDPAEAVRLADRVAILHEGRLAQVGTLDELTARPASVDVAAFVRGFAPGVVHLRPGRSVRPR
jgi:glycine betaine/proline transport system ATP-binding protein